jgi:hypothetical protein
MEKLREACEKLEIERMGIIQDIVVLNNHIIQLGHCKETQNLANDREFARGKADGLLRAQNLVMGIMVEIMESTKK